MVWDRFTTERVWIKVKQPKRGRPVMVEPNQRDKDILRFIKRGYSLTDLSKRYKVYKQRIHQIRKRWQYGHYNFKEIRRQICP